MILTKVKAASILAAVALTAACTNSNGSQGSSDNAKSGRNKSKPAHQQLALASGPAFQSPQACVDLLGAKTIVAGKVCTAVENDTLKVVYSTLNGWTLEDMHFWVGTDLLKLPATKKGNPIPGQFPYKQAAPSGATSSEFIVPLASLGIDPASCSDTVLHAVAHADIYKKLAKGSQREGAYGAGPRILDKGNWATSFDINITCANDPRATLANLEASGKIPKLERSETIAGPDNDNNGVRDDIDAIIIKKYETGPQRQAVLQLAKAMQKTLLTDPSDSLAVQTAANTVSRAIGCVFEQFLTSTAETPELVASQIRSYTANTKQRLQAFLQYDKAMNGKVISIPRGKVCD
ncbi:hypothetical protein [Oligoflexus tunisiensis]|uniref:hypothetical protein n=1 Tax=Oligoflexus tunisiensis TaxID=708132 RepID=UPI00114C8B01|nr:hypothetical protein [Oligoflexus tunisiensis]